MTETLDMDQMFTTDIEYTVLHARKDFKFKSERLKVQCLVY